jgi:hypothetical protein
VSEKLALVGNGHFDIPINHYALAAEAGVNLRVDGPIYKVFFFIRYFLEVVHPTRYIDMAGTASANPAAIMLQFYIIIEANVEYRFPFRNRKLDRIMAGLFKVDPYLKNIHFPAKLIKSGQPGG